jgi:hypothetical protein
MIKCDSFHRCSDKCVFCMDACETQGGTIVCDIAEECETEEEILQMCQYAERINYLLNIYK